MPPTPENQTATTEVAVSYEVLKAKADTGFITVKFFNPFRAEGVEEDETNNDREKTIRISDCFNEDGTPNADALKARIEDHARAELHRFKIARDAAASENIDAKVKQKSLDDVMKNIGTGSFSNTSPPAAPAPIPTVGSAEEVEEEAEEEIEDEEEELDLEEDEDDDEPAPSGGL